MKHQQVRTVLVVWAFFIVVSCLFPPWEGNISIEVDGIKFEESGVSYSFPFRFILDPPRKRYLGNSEVRDKVHSDVQLLIINSAEYGYFIDFRRLFVIWVLITVVFGTVLVFAYHKAVTEEELQKYYFEAIDRREKEQPKKIIDNESKDQDNA